MAADPMTLLQNGLVATADRASSVCDITGRSDGNLLPWSSDIPSLVPVATFLVSTLVPRVEGYTALVTVSAWAGRGDVAQALLDAVIAALNQPALFAAGCDAVILTEIRREIPSEDSDDPARADVDLTLWYTP